MAQFNQLNNSASAIIIPPAGYTAVLYDEGSSMRLFDHTGEITPTSSQASWTASFAHQANGFTTGSKRMLGSFSLDDNLTVSGSGYISASLDVSGAITASVFKGSGAGLVDIDASSIIGLNLARISTGSFSASIYGIESYVSESYDTASLATSSFTIPATGSFHVNADTIITGSISTLSGSFSGSGANLFDISASAILGLNLSRISTGSYTASIDETGSFKLNADIYVSSSTTPTDYTSTASIVTDGGMTVKADAYFSSSVYVKGNLTILGTQSVEYVTSSHINFGDNILNLNTSDKNLRFGGIAVIDSGSSEAGNSGSFLWDSVNNQWIEDVTLNATRSSAAFIAGPLNTASLGDEIGITQFSIPVGLGGNNITSSMLTISQSILRAPMNSIFGSHITSSLIVSGTVTQTGSLIVSGGAIHMHQSASVSGTNLFGTASWAINAVNGGSVTTVSGSNPTGSATGSLWWNTEDGNLYIQVNSPTGSTWVPATNTVAASTYGATITTAFASSATWSFAHGLNTLTPIVQVYTGSQVMVPSTIRAVDANNIQITFAQNTAGSAIASTGVGGPTSSSFALTAATSSFAHTASLAILAVTASNALTSSYAGNAQPTLLHVMHGTAQVISSGVVTTLTGWGTPSVSQNAGEWNGTTGVFTATKAGMYLVNASGQPGNNTYQSTNAEISLLITKSGVNQGYGRWVSPASSVGPSLTSTIFANAIVSLAVGQTITLTVFQNAVPAGMTMFTNATFLTITEIPARITR